MSASSWIALLIGGGAVGTLAAAVVTAISERRERLRDRLITGCVAFLEAAHESRRSLDRYRRYASGSVKLEETYRELQHEVVLLAERQPQAAEDAATKVLSRLKEMADAFKKFNLLSFDAVLDEFAAGVKATALDEARALIALEEATLGTELSEQLELLVTALDRWVEGMARRSAANGDWRRSYDTLNLALLRLNVLVAPRRAFGVSVGRSGAAQGRECAESFYESVASARESVNRQLQESPAQDPGIGREDVDQAFDAMDQHLNGFVAAVSHAT